MENRIFFPLSENTGTKNWPYWAGGQLRGFKFSPLYLYIAMYTGATFYSLFIFIHAKTENSIIDDTIEMNFPKSIDVTKASFLFLLLKDVISIQVIASIPKIQISFVTAICLGRIKSERNVEQNSCASAHLIKRSEVFSEQCLLFFFLFLFFFIIILLCWCFFTTILLTLWGLSITSLLAGPLTEPLRKFLSIVISSGVSSSLILGVHAD